jgi:hypothetical protein
MRYQYGPGLCDHLTGLTNPFRSPTRVWNSCSVTIEKGTTRKHYREMKNNKWEKLTTRKKSALVK